MVCTEDLLNLALSATKTGVFEVDLETQKATWSPECHNISGRGEPFADMTDFLDHVHAEDRSRVQRLMEQAIAEGGECATEYRILRPDGEVRWVSCQSRVSGSRMIGTINDVTERELSVRALKRSQDRYHRLLESSPDAMWVVIDGTIRFVNSAALRLLGAEVEGQVLGESPLRFVHPGYREIVSRRAREVLEGRSVPIREEKLVGLDGRVVDVEVIPLFYEDERGKGVLVVMRDLADRRRSEESERRLRQVVENIREVFWMSNLEQDTILYVSPSFEEIWGIPCEPLDRVSTAWSESIHPEDRERVLRTATGEYDVDYRIVRPDGSERWIHDRAFLVRDAAGEPCALAGVAEDITERRQLELQLRQAQKMEAVGMLAGGIAHDFNNILTVVIGNATLLAEELEAGELREEAEQILEASRHASDLTRQLLAFSSKQVLRPQELDLNQVVSGIGRMLERVLGEQVRIEIACSPEPATVQADRGALEQVLLNLAVNARDAMPEGGDLVIATGIMNVVDPPAEGAAGPHVFLEVRDTGEGISPENLARIFEPFFTTKSGGRGTGLGLATVYGIVKQHRGWITAESEVGRGTTFRIYLPSTASGMPRTETKASRPSEETILVVDDEPAVRRLVARALSRAGYRVLTAESGPRALELWHDGIDLLLTDLSLTENMDGAALVRELRIRGGEPKVLMVSGYKSDAFELDANSFLQKPFTPAELTEQVRSTLDRE